MGTGDAPKVEFPVKVTAEGVDEASASLDALRTAVDASEASIREMQGTMRRLKGSSEEVSKAKAALKTRVQEEQAAVSAASLAIHKQGTTYDNLATQAKKLRASKAALLLEEKAALKESIAEAKATAAARKASEDAKTSIADLAKESSGLGSALTSGAGGLAALAGAAVIAAAAVLGVVAGVGYAVASLARFILEAGGAARQAGLLREAATGSEVSARNLGTQIDALGAKVPTAKGALNDMANELAKNNLGGQLLVDTFNAVAQASAALGDSAGKKVEDFVTRGRLTQRFSLSRLELVGTGLKFDDVAKQLAGSLHVGINDARAALASGRVKLADGAAALRKAVEARFGDVNAKQALGLDVQVVKLKESFAALATGVDLGPLLTDVRDVFALFGQNSATGRAMKQIVTLLGSGMISAAHEAKPVVMGLIKGTIVATLDLAIALRKAQVAIKSALGNRQIAANVDVFKLAVSAAKVAVLGLALLVVSLGSAALVASAPILALGALLVGPFVIGAMVATKAIEGIRSAVKSLRGFLSGGAGMADAAAGVVDGLVDGLAKGGPAVKKAMSALAGLVDTGITGPLQIHSPSKVARKWGDEGIDAGLAGGIEAGAPRVASAIDGIVPSSPMGAGLGSSRGATVTIGTLEVRVEVVGSSKDLATPSPAFVGELTKALKDALRGLAVPT